jgi:hypothetical protein
MAQQFRDRADVVASKEEVGREGMAEGMASGGFDDPRRASPSWKARYN